jgi:hypothetical protein
MEAILELAKLFATSFVVEEQAFFHAFSEIQVSSDAHLRVAETSQGMVGYVLGFDHNSFFALRQTKDKYDLCPSSRCFSIC